jgi:hypothetical protein
MVALPGFAHHGYAAYDMTTTKSFKCVVTNYEMVNPHSQIDVDVKGADGNVEHWVIEALGVRGMEGQGFKFDSLKAGDEIAITYSPAKSGAHSGVLLKLTLPDGTVLPKSSAAQ